MKMRRRSSAGRASAEAPGVVGSNPIVSSERNTMLNLNVSGLKEAGCVLAETPQELNAAHIESGGDPCTTGCRGFDNGLCPGYQRFHTRSASVHRNCGRCRKVSGQLVMYEWHERTGERRCTPVCPGCLASLKGELQYA